MLQSLRRFIEPSVCQDFPINLLLLPVLYFALIYIYTLSHSDRSEGFAVLLKVSAKRMARNAVSHHPSGAFASLGLLLIILLQISCAIPAAEKREERGQLPVSGIALK